MEPQSLLWPGAMWLEVSPGYPHTAFFVPRPLGSLAGLAGGISTSKPYSLPQTVLSIIRWQEDVAGKKWDFQKTWSQDHVTGAGFSMA